MGNIGAPEIMLLAIFALIFFGPKRLPEIGRQIGRALAEVRRVSRDFEREVRDAAEPFEREIRDAEEMARDTYTLDSDHSRYIAPASADDGDPNSGATKPAEPDPPRPE